ncbi:MAG TPA: ELWxxDGT repeat protein [Thermoanaerobaculia bacterium]|jgi:ELWxxDGT repeat protein|nr:ELWxxDGT repeat protein [Thermoanaerobaculia bacterium]
MFSRAAAFLLLVLLCAVPGAGISPYRVADINPVASPASSSPSDFVPFRGISFFSADDGVSGRGPWRSDGTAAGTYQLQDVGSFRVMAKTDGGIFFFAGEITDSALWVTDGTRSGTFRLAGGLDFRSSWWAWVPEKHLFFFSADDGLHGVEVWRTDGTAAGTYLVKDIHPGSASSEPRDLTSFQGKLYFFADDGVQGHALWASDGTPQGTRLVKDTWPGSEPLIGPFDLAAIGNRLLFFAPSPSHGIELWRSDGTPGGPRWRPSSSPARDLP